MMKKIIKWVLIVLGAYIVITIVAALIFAIVTYDPSKVKATKQEQDSSQEDNNIGYVYKLPTESSASSTNNSSYEYKPSDEPSVEKKHIRSRFNQEPFYACKVAQEYVKSNLPTGNRESINFPPLNCNASILRNKWEARGRVTYSNVLLETVTKYYVVRLDLKEDSDEADMNNWTVISFVLSD